MSACLSCSYRVKDIVYTLGVGVGAGADAGTGAGAGAGADLGGVGEAVVGVFLCC